MPIYCLLQSLILIITIIGLFLLL
ncbi:hypothetical protein CY0110_19587 [Crocosphaera chwakensis CCY0110]|uniref:Uncharacterized protein n=1 Tax=Crocosphaera chwakensis CCY0110 TaxID=391612 RepID=A3IJP9_9CHRO|nr:hypothetical protein CY0110_19587 [Crocosphaera chwakensis CCY0110]